MLEEYSNDKYLGAVQSSLKQGKEWMVLRRSLFSLLTRSCSMERSCSTCPERDSTWFCKASMVPVNLVQEDGKMFREYRGRTEAWRNEEPHSPLYLLLRGLAVHHQRVVGALQLPGSPVQLLVHFGVLLVHVPKNLQLL